MELVIEPVKMYLLCLLEPPWRSVPDVGVGTHAIIWVFGWAWTIAGLILGALVAPSFVQIWGLTNTPYQDWLMIVIAVLAGFLVQLLEWVVFIPLAGLIILCIGFVGSIALEVFAHKYLGDDWVASVGCSFMLMLPLILAIIPIPFFPFVVVGYGIHRYLTWMGPGQNSVTIAFAGGLLIKMFAIPLVKGIVAGALLRWFMKWLRGGKYTKKPA